MIITDEVYGFEWDKGNILKNWEKHRVSRSHNNRGALSRQHWCFNPSLPVPSEPTMIVASLLFLPFAGIPSESFQQEI